MLCPAATDAAFIGDNHFLGGEDMLESVCRKCLDVFILQYVLRKAFPKNKSLVAYPSLMFGSRICAVWI